MMAATTIHDAIGNWIFFRLMNAPAELKGAATGIDHVDEWIKAKLRGVDEIGIWLENPHFRITYFRDREGNTILPDQQKETTETSLILIRWQFIASVLRVEADEVNEGRPSIGFHTLGQQTESA